MDPSSKGLSKASFEHDPGAQTLGEHFKARKEAISAAYTEFLKENPAFKDKPVVLYGFGAMAGPMQSFAAEQVTAASGDKKFCCLSMGGWDWILENQTQKFKNPKCDKNLLIVDITSPLDTATHYNSFAWGKSSLPSADQQVGCAVQIETFRTYKSNLGNSFKNWHEKDTYASSDFDADLKIMNRMAGFKELSKKIDEKKFNSEMFVTLLNAEEKVNFTDAELNQLKSKEENNQTKELFASVTNSLRKGGSIGDSDKNKIQDVLTHLAKQNPTDRDPQLLKTVREFFDFLNTRSTATRGLAEGLLKSTPAIKDMLWPTFIVDPADDKTMSRIKLMSYEELSSLQKRAEAYSSSPGHRKAIEIQMQKIADEKKLTLDFIGKNSKQPDKILGTLGGVSFGTARDVEIMARCATKETQALAHQILNEAINNPKKLDSVEFLDQFRGAYRLVNKQLNDLVELKDLNKDQIKEMQAVFAVLVDAGNTNVKKLISPTDQMLLAKAHTILLDECIKNGQPEPLLAHLAMVDKIQVMENQPLGDIQALAAKLATNPIDWVQSGDTSVRRREVRTQLKTLQGIDPEKSHIEISFLLPRHAREQFNTRLSGLEDMKCLDSNTMGITKKEANIFYNQKDFKTGKYNYVDPNSQDGGQAVNMGQGVFIESKDSKIQLSIGSEEEKWNSYQKVKIQVDPSVTSTELNQFLSRIGLQAPIFESTPADVDNEKIARLANAKAPEAMAFKTDPRDVVSAGKNQTDLVERSADMQLCDIGFGRMEYCDGHAVRDFWNAGGRGFGATLGHIGISFQAADLIANKGYTVKKGIETSAYDLSLILKGGFLFYCRALRARYYRTGQCSRRKYCYRCWQPSFCKAYDA